MTKQEDFYKHIEDNNLEGVKLSLKDKSVHPEKSESESLRMAVNFGFTNIVEVLLKDKRSNPNDKSKHNMSVFGLPAIIIATEYGYTDIVKLLLKDKRVDPSCVDNSAIKTAHYRNKTSILKMLWKDKRVQDKCIYSYDKKTALSRYLKHEINKILIHNKVQKF